MNSCTLSIKATPKPFAWLKPVLLFLLTGLSACATRSAPVREYEWQFRYHAAQPNLTPPTLFFLVDGLSVSALQTALKANRIPHLQAFFLQNRLQLGRAVFPTLTYPNITSILTTAPVNEHPIIGNKVLSEQNEVINFESIQRRGKLNEWIAPRTVFTRLTRQRRTSVSLDHYFFAGATTRQHDDLQSGVAYVNGDYSYIDSKAIDSLTGIVADVSAELLPSLLFIHLIGVDALSHEKGPDSPEVQAYLAKLDAALTPLFNRLIWLESAGTPFATLLTSDHGFMTADLHADLEGWFRNNGDAAQVEILNQGRLASLYFPQHWSAKDRTAVLKSLALQPAVSMTLERSGNQILLHSPRLNATLQYHTANCGTAAYEISFKREVGLRREASGTSQVRFCPDEWDRRQKDFARELPPYFVSLLGSYFYSVKRPQAIVLAADRTTFGGARGDHGGITLEEQLVPVLHRNIRLQSEGPIPTWQLLRILKL
ncbi:MAG: alkaline phosphatase family protein [Methylotenera sp.]|nr:alkaline phosphatase family protein [Oligoflexia bacterium]